ncbi:hypothetical protein KR215_010563, partial [Drosophila sulfurigaster]
ILITGKCPITKRYKVAAWFPCIMLKLSRAIKYLEVVLDSKPSWKLNVLESVKKATGALYMAKVMLSCTWGLSPNLMRWIYISVVRPILTYGILVRWQATEKRTYLSFME